MTQDRGGGWIQTYSGGQFFPLDPRPEDLKLVDIAIGLSRECRFGNQCQRFYSVAEHSILIQRAAKKSGYNERAQRAALFHDASEGLGLKDICRPIKSRLDEYRKAENTLMITMARAFDFEWPLLPAIKELDDAILLDEREQNMGKIPAPWTVDYTDQQRLHVTLQFWSPERAFDEFVLAAIECGAVAASD